MPRAFRIVATGPVPGLKRNTKATTEATGGTSAGRYRIVRQTPVARFSRASSPATSIAQTVRMGTRITTNHSVLNAAVPMSGSSVNRYS